MTRLNIGPAAQVAEGASLKFEFERMGVGFEGFVIRHQGRWVAYENRCRHLPLPLDYGDNRFFTPDGQFLVCSSHGAIYEPLTGRCVGGPCAGSTLQRLTLIEENGELIVEFEEE